MQYAQVLQYTFISIVVCAFSWLAARSKKLGNILLWVPVAALIPVSILTVVLPSESVKSELYAYWDVPSFLIKSLSVVVFTAILLLGSGVSSWLMSVRWGKPKWLGITSGIMAALILYIPAMLAGLVVACMSGDCL
ncbi:MAG TPA: hypothetical protein VJB60_02700 [Candidatus Peribacterales bacterium]|nr:hypothetical protein [Candidatus Peribacterales bacterium]